MFRFALVLSLLAGALAGGQPFAPAQDKKDVNVAKKISVRAFRARAAGSPAARAIANPKLAAVTFPPTKGNPMLLPNSSPEFSLNSPTVNVTFAGENWADADKTTVTEAVKAILKSSYLSALNQKHYGSDGKAVSGTSSVSEAELKLDLGNSGARYPSSDNLDAFFAKSPVGNKQPNTINVVVNDTKASQGAIGVNWSRGEGKAGSYVYVGTRTLGEGFDKDAFTEVISHELAEAMVAGVQITDPGNFGKGQQGNQVADNEPEDLGYYAVLTGTKIRVQAYWSNKDEVWIVPGGMK